MTARFKISLGVLSLAAAAVPATIVSAETENTEQSAFREAIKFGFSGEAIQGGVMIGDAPAGTLSLSFDGEPVPIDEDGKFIIAFNRDAGQAANLIATLDTGQTVRQFINIAPRKWKIEHVSINRRATTRSAAFLALRGPELARINAARAIDSGSKGWRQSFVWPAKGRISGQFGSQRIYNGDPGSYHSGTDVAVPAGTPFVAPADGVVTLAAETPFTLEGHLLIVDHGMGLSSAFLHCQRLDVKVGDRVKQGQLLGTVGRTGRATGPHMHWGLKWRDARLDPAKLAGATGS